MPFKKGYTPWNKGKRHSEETRRKISESNMGRVVSEETRKKVSRGNKKRWQDPEFHQAMSDKHKGKTVPKEVREKMSESHKKRIFGEERKEQLDNARKRRKFDLDTRIRMSKSGKAKWRKKSYREFTLENNRGLFRKDMVQPYTYISRVAPNKLEERVLAIVPNCVKYVGNGKLWISVANGNKNPDFVVHPLSKTKKVIEVFGDYWHKKKEEKSVIEAYQQVGIECMVIWEHDVHENIREVQEKVNHFTGYKQGKAGELH